MAVDTAKITRLLKWEMAEVTRSYITNNLNPYLKDRTEKFGQAMQEQIDWEHLTKENAKELGFMEWSYTAGKELWLIPYWLYLAIPHNIPLIDAETGKEFFFNRADANTDSKFGMLPYGLLFDGNPPVLLEDEVID